jgi:hypothetical protein
MTMNEGEWITLLEPMMPAEENRRLEDLSMELAQKASALNNQVKMVSDQPKGKVYLGFPINVVEDWFPKLSPSQ